MHTKGELKTVATFDKLYLHIGTMRIADIPNTGAISEEEAIANAERLVKCWNCHDELVDALEIADKALIVCLRYFLGTGPQPTPEQFADIPTKIQAALAKAKPQP